MLWSEVLEPFDGAVRALAELVATVAEWGAPALGTWDVAGLTGHTLRQVEAPARYLAEPEPEGPALPDAAAHFAAYLGARDEDPAAMDASVAERGADDGRSLAGPGAAARFLAALHGAHVALARVEPDRLVATPFGPMRIGDYVRTRTFEVVAHGLDLAHAVGADWQPPRAARHDALRLVGELAESVGRAEALLAAATGRPWVDPAEVFPLLR